MIYTVTLNPSIDYIVHAETIEMGAVNRMSADLKLPGGKGINVSRILNRLEVPAIATGFLGGFTGRFIDDWLEAEGVPTDFTPIKSDTRINIKLKAEVETEINGLGPSVSSLEIARLKQSLQSLNANDIVVLAGSVLPCLPQNFYQELIELIKAQDAEFVIDTTGENLLNALPHQPLLIKPNKEELGELYHTEITELSEVIHYGKKLLNDGPRFVLISMAGDGALLFTKQGVYQSNVLKRPLKNSVGAGDSMIAGFVGRWTQTNDPIEAFKWGVACGSATAFSDDLATAAFISELLPEVTITILEEDYNEN